MRNEIEKLPIVGSAKLLGNYLGQKVLVDGSIAKIPWQHLMQTIQSCPIILYLNMGQDQVVIYTKQTVDCGSKLRVRGTVIEARGKSKKPGSNQIVTEYQIVVDDYECIEEK